MEESFALLHKHELLFNDGNAEHVDSLTYAWRNLSALVRPGGLLIPLQLVIIDLIIKLQGHCPPSTWPCVCVQVVQNQNFLVQIQPSMKADLLSAVKSFQVHVQSFSSEYNHRCTRRFTPAAA